MPENTTAQNNNNDSDKRAQLRRAALEYHEFPKPGKLAIAATKQMINQYPWLYERASPLSWKSKA